MQAEYSEKDIHPARRIDVKRMYSEKECTSREGQPCAQRLLCCPLIPWLTVLPLMFTLVCREQRSTISHPTSDPLNLPECSYSFPSPRQLLDHLSGSLAASVQVISSSLQHCGTWGQCPFSNMAMSAPAKVKCLFKL